MRIPVYWAQSSRSAEQPDDGRRYFLSCWQSSDVSVDEARQRAEARLDAVVQKVQSGAELDRYGYGDRPLREESTQQLTDASGRATAVVTRNAYGALILNAANAMFIDIDFAQKDASIAVPGPLLRLFKRAVAAPAVPSQEETYIQRVAEWAQHHPDLGIRVYRTFGGLRCLVTNRVYDPEQSEALDVLQQLKSDPLYVRLCKAQGCFRARLTPKPWRCETGPPPSRFPWDSTTSEMKYRKWEQDYERIIRSYATARFVSQLGPADIHPDIAPIVDLHDSISAATSGRPLA